AGRGRGLIMIGGSSIVCFSENGIAVAANVNAKIKHAINNCFVCLITVEVNNRCKDNRFFSTQQLFLVTGHSLSD
ncbi:MAG: hypothetical protein IKH49_06670, partial [Bacteroidales bacterium]|nr:hypothetical protein [Bacteroidales bacterium]